MDEDVGGPVGAWVIHLDKDETMNKYISTCAERRNY